MVFVPVLPEHEQQQALALKEVTAIKIVNKAILFTEIFIITSAT